ncbi:atrial natriuretic peptide receptor 3-like [Tachypleus tridentatus]|uniref:atrial natriuretic peptide receptor 3-like n=1 Tax=Tachypleus tridentatus TaxID=6853 RepID=UPI003FD574D7
MVRFITSLFTNILNYFVIFVLQGISSENNVDGPISIIRSKHAAFIRHESIHERQKNPPTVNIVVLAPNNDTLPYSLHKVVPGVLYAIQTLKAQGLDSIEGRLIQPIYKDTLCSSTEGPLAAFDFYVSGVVDVFLGPLCTYALAPVARYSAAWNLPLLTVGGQNNNFDAKNPHYRLMTRMNGSFSQIGELFLKLLRKFHWKTVALLFHDFRDQSLGHSNCFFTLGAVFTALGRQSFHVAFDETKPEERDFYRLLWDISTQARRYVFRGRGKKRHGKPGKYMMKQEADLLNSQAPSDRERGGKCGPDAGGWQDTKECGTARRCVTKRHQSPLATLLGDKLLWQESRSSLLSLHNSQRGPLHRDYSSA